MLWGITWCLMYRVIGLTVAVLGRAGGLPSGPILTKLITSGVKLRTDKTRLACCLCYTKSGWRYSLLVISSSVNVKFTQSSNQWEARANT
jgi:hypothetical protein